MVYSAFTLGAASRSVTADLLVCASAAEPTTTANANPSTTLSSFLMHSS